MIDTFFQVEIIIQILKLFKNYFYLTKIFEK